MARFICRMPEQGPLPLILQWLQLPAGGVDARDRESALHADRHYPCVKACFYINDGDERHSAYVYCPGSHRLTWRRLLYEYRYSVQHQRWKAGLELNDPWIELERGRPVPSRATRQFLGLREVPCVHPKNTLVLSNNMGFHRRGVLEPGLSRQQIRILFYAEQTPWLGRLLRRFGV